MIDVHPPKFQWGQQVSAVSDLYNDGSFPDAPAGGLLVAAGEKGEILKVGTHVETNTHVYLVEFRQKIVVGCFEAEISPVFQTKMEMPPTGLTRSEQ